MLRASDVAGPMDNERIGLTILRLTVPNTSLFSPLTFMYLMFY